MRTAGSIRMRFGLLLPISLIVPLAVACQGADAEQVTEGNRDGQLATPAKLVSAARPTIAAAPILGAGITDRAMGNAPDGWLMTFAKKKPEKDTTPIAPPDGENGDQALAVRHASVKHKEWKNFAPFSVAAGSKLSVVLRHEKGDPDLYVRFNKQPTSQAWDCRPRVRGLPGNERCELQVPQGATTAHVRVRGHGHGKNRFALHASVQAPPAATIHPVATALAQSFVAALIRCQGNNGSAFVHEVEPDGMMGFSTDNATVVIAPLIDAVIDLGGAIPHEDQVAACLATIENLSCDGTVGIFGNAFPEDCRAALQPTRALGEACLTPFECATGFCDTASPPNAELSENGVECGRCAMAPGPREETCIDTGCPTGLVCVADDDTYTRFGCVPPAGVGEGCNRVPCADGLLCGYQQDTGEGLCRQPPQQGEPCLDVGQCQRPGLVCDVAVTGLCVPVPQLGEPCSFECADGVTCSQTNAVCVPTPVEGEPCPDLSCAGGAECVRSLSAQGEWLDGTCTMVLRGQREGDRCTPLPFGEPSCGQPTLVDGLSCAGEPGAEVCQRAVVVGDGQVCDVRQSTMQGTRYCLHQFTTKACVFAGPTATTGVCASRPTTGAACGPDLPCDIHRAVCSQPPYSDGAEAGFEGVCIGFAGLGQACNEAQCAPGLLCDHNMLPEVPVCKAAADLPNGQISSIAACLAR